MPKISLYHIFVVEDGIWGCIPENVANNTESDWSGFECLIKKRDTSTKYVSTETKSKDYCLAVLEVQNMGSFLTSAVLEDDSVQIARLG